MLRTAVATAPRTTTDIVFDKLHEEIVTLQLLPGSRISEAEIARRMGVSRQPVRDAFNRLGNLDLLVIRPQRATKVRRFCIAQIANARFMRLAVELEVIARACTDADASWHQQLSDNLGLQADAIDAAQTDRFHALDYQFHQIICQAAGHPLAFDLIEQCKRQVDRLCVLSLEREEVASAVLEDHQELAVALKAGDVARSQTVIRRHLARLDGTIHEIYAAHSDYFE